MLTKLNFDQETRLRIEQNIASTRGDIGYILEQFKGRQPRLEIWLRQLIVGTAGGRHNSRGSGRKKHTATLENDLHILYKLRAYLHAKLVKSRGEEVFASGSGLDRLAAVGIVKYPSVPIQGFSGRKNISAIHARYAQWFIQQADEALGKKDLPANIAYLSTEPQTMKWANDCATMLIQLGYPKFRISKNDACRAQRRLTGKKVARGHGRRRQQPKL